MWDDACGSVTPAVQRGCRGALLCSTYHMADRNFYTVHKLNDGYRLSKGTMSADCTGIFTCVCVSYM